MLNYAYRFYTSKGILEPPLLLPHNGNKPVNVIRGAVGQAFDFIFAVPLS